MYIRMQIKCRILFMDDGFMRHIVINLCQFPALMPASISYVATYVHNFPRIHLFVSLFLEIHCRCIPMVSFVLPTQSATYLAI